MLDLAWNHADQPAILYSAPIYARVLKILVLFMNTLYKDCKELTKYLGFLAFSQEILLNKPTEMMAMMAPFCV